MGKKYDVELESDQNILDEKKISSPSTKKSLDKMLTKPLIA